MTENTQDPTRINIAFDPIEKRMQGVAIHGNTPFDVSFISEIATRLWQGGCERGLILPKFVQHLVSLYPWEQYEVKHDLKTSMTVRMYDSRSQGFDQVEEIAQWVSNRRKTGTVLVHCQAGLNRSSLIAARSLMIDGMTADEAITQIRDSRSPACLCNPSFEDWLREI